ncbi:GNAT family N-acetyltransferase [Xylanimonas sp. McL0601]|uniref:GNAT family N-acetyltransferase n=1 Tax=Xylanimonas sp. McL0601 TaxID=3414739 RepID=UPI003CEC3D5D
MAYTVRRVRSDEWQAVRAIRLESLQDPDAHLAFLDTFEDASARPDLFWQERAANAATGGAVAHYVVVDDDGRWVGTATGLLEEPGSADFEGRPVEQRQVHVVGVWLNPGHRGRGLIQRAIDAVVEWAREQGAERARLYVHADNARARAAYLKDGFVPSGEAFEGSIGREEELARPVS